MSSARNSFNESISLLERTLNTNIVQDLASNKKLHNERARVIRNGIAVTSFSVLEEFLKRRTGEILLEIAASGVLFGDLPESLQEAVTHGAVSSIEYISGHKKRSGEDHILFIQQEAAVIASTQGHPFSLSANAIGWDKANLSAEDLSGFFKKLKIKGGWKNVELISSRINRTILDPSGAFANAAKRRHRAAHSPSAATPYGDLKDFLIAARVIGFAFDCMMSHAKYLIVSGDANFRLNTSTIDHSSISFRFAVQRSPAWLEYKDLSKRPLKVFKGKAAALVRAKGRALAKKEVVVVIGQGGFLTDWSIDY